MNISEIFQQQDTGSGVRWTVTCITAAALVGAGLVTDQIIAAATAMIVGHAIINGKLPLMGVNHAINLDSDRSSEESDGLSRVPGESMREFTAAVEDASSVTKIAVTLNACSRRVDRRDALDALLNHASKAWHCRLDPIESVVVTLPMMGLLFTLLGLTFAMGDIGKAIANVDLDEISSIFDILPLFVDVFMSMALATVTTFEGLAAALYLRGHVDNTDAAIEMHLANVELAARLLPTVEVIDEAETPNSDEAEQIAYQILEEEG